MKHLNKNSKLQNFLFWLVVLFLVFLILFFIRGQNNQATTRHLSATNFERQIKQKKIKHFVIQPSNATYQVTGNYKLSKAQRQKVAHNVPIVINFKSDLLQNDSTTKKLLDLAKKEHVSYSVHPQKQKSFFWSEMLISAAPLLIFFLLFYFMMKKMSGGMTSSFGKMGKGGFKPVNNKKNKVRFKDVAGEDAEKQELVEIVDFLKNPQKYSRLGAKIPHGVLLEGPPGTGKTLLAKAVAGEAGVPFYSVSGSDFVQMFVGVGASRVRDLFKKAKKHAPAIIFIDEIDAIGKRRSSSGMSDQEQEQTLNQLLVEMNGFKQNEGIIVIGATNRADVLDPALTRPGRFDRKVLVNLPDVRGRKEILDVHAKGKHFSPKVNFAELARQTPSFSGADLANVLNEGALLAARFNHKYITKHDVSVAVDRTLMGPAKKHAVMSKHDRHIVADHEAGHTIVGLVLSNARKVHKVTIIPRGRAGGYTMMLPREGQILLSRKNAMEQLAGLLGGRSAEEIIYHQRTSGASGDLSQATKLARMMVTQYGMTDKLGDVALESRIPGRPKYSEHTAYDIDETIKQLITHAHHVALKVINGHRQQHKIISEALLKYETLDAKELKSLYETGHMPEGDPKVKDLDSDMKSSQSSDNSKESSNSDDNNRNLKKN